MTADRDTEAAPERADELAAKSARSAYKKRLAAEEALWLSRKYGVDVVTSKEGAFCTLAALLYGKPQADLRRHCRAALRNRGAGIKRVRDLR